MSQYNKTVLTSAGLELAKRANAGQAKFEITRAVASADDWSNKTIQDLEEVTAIPNIMQQGTVMDTEEVESNNSVIGVSLCFANKDLSAGYQIKIIGVYVKEEGQENDFLYAVTTAVTPEYMPDFNDKVLYRFNMQMYLVIGKAQAVNVVINDGASVTHKQFDNYKNEVTANLEKIENAHKEDMSHVVKSASINGGDEILPDEAGKLELVVPDPDLSKYVSLEQLGELLKTKADKADTYTKSNIDDIHSKSYFRKQGIDQNGNAIEIRKNAIKLDNGGYAFDIWNDDWTASKLHDVLAQLPNKADTTTVNSQVEDAKNTAQSKLDQAKSDLTSLIDNIKNFNVDSYKGGIPNTDMNKITDAGLYGFANTRLTNSPYTDERWGLLLVIREFNNDPNSIDQFITSRGSLFWRNISLTNNRYPNWNRFADDGDIAGLKDQINAVNDSINAVSDKVNVAVPLYRRITAGNTWNDILGTSNDKRVLMSIRDEGGANTLGNFSAAVAFGGGDTKGMLNVAFDDHTARIIGGNGDAPVWHEDIAWKSDVNDLRNQVQQLKDNQFEVQTFTDATAAANWEAQRPGKRMAIVNS